MSTTPNHEQALPDDLVDNMLRAYLIDTGAVIDKKDKWKALSHGMQAALAYARPIIEEPWRDSLAHTCGQLIVEQKGNESLQSQLASVSAQRDRLREALQAISNVLRSDVDVFFGKDIGNQVRAALNAEKDIKNVE